jgi:GNAT superfamily N-acetyltransferase
MNPPAAEPQALTIRQAVLADLEPLAALFDQYRQFQGQAGDLPAARHFLRDRFEHGQSVVFMAWRGDQGLGFAQLFPSFSSVALKRVFILNDLFVAATARRLGVASALLHAVEAHAWQLGAVRVSLNVARDNLEGQQLYAARGWAADELYFAYHRHRPG